jgi:cation diffusion facilitator CzcD-associated flavoprotein CzcO
MRHERASIPTPDSTNSFWHSEPNEFLLGHRTTEQLPEEADIVIVGSGITGTSAARYLSEDARAKGKRIVVLDAREACWCATGRVSLPTSKATSLYGYSYHTLRLIAEVT